MTVKINDTVVGTAIVTADVHTGQTSAYKFDFSVPANTANLTVALNGYSAMVQKSTSLNLFNAVVTLEGDKKGVDYVRAGKPAAINGGVSVLDGKAVMLQTNGSAVSYKLK